MIYKALKYYTISNYQIQENQRLQIENQRLLLNFLAPIPKLLWM